MLNVAHIQWKQLLLRKMTEINKTVTFPTNGIVVRCIWLTFFFPKFVWSLVLWMLKGSAAEYQQKRVDYPCCLQHCSRILSYTKNTHISWLQGLNLQETVAILKFRPNWIFKFSYMASRFFPIPKISVLHLVLWNKFIHRGQLSSDSHILWKHNYGCIQLLSSHSHRLKSS